MRFIAVGRVFSVRGLRGEVRFRYYNESESNLSGYAALFADREGQKVELTLSRVQRQAHYFLIQFAEVETSESASFLVGRELFVRESDLPGLDDDEYYDYQLIGLNVINEHNEQVGRVTEVVHTKANDIIVIEGKTEMLVPMQEGFILDIDIDAASIRIAERACIE